MKYSIIKTNLGFFGIVFSEEGIFRTFLPVQTGEECFLNIMEHKSEYFGPLYKSELPNEFKKIFNDYFSGRKVELSKLTINIFGTDFEKKVWKTCMKIPYGEVRSYSWIAQQIENPDSSRAVGNALGKNPIAPIVPCHRVISTNGIGGFSSGIEIKRKLLELESSKFFGLFK